MERLIDWVRQIVFFLIFMSLFYQLVSDKKYKSYLKLFASLVLILLTMNPLLKFFDMQKSLEFQQDVFAYPREVEEFRLKAEQVQGQQYEDILESYRQTVEEQLRRMAERSGLYVISCEAELSGETESFGQVTAVWLMVSYRRLDGGPDAGQEGSLTGSVEEIAEVRIPPVRMETAAPESESNQPGAGENPMEADTVPPEPELPENQDIISLKEQIILLYQLNPEQVIVNLKK